MRYIKIPKATEKVLKNKLNDLNLSDRWNDVLEQYGIFVQETPDIGGKDNLLWDKLYVSLAVFSLYEITGKTMTCDEIEEIVVNCLIGRNREMGKIINFNWRWFQNLYRKMYIIAKRQSDSHIQDGSWHNTWRFELNPEGRKEGVNVRLYGCPVYDFAKKHGYDNIMQGLCRSDYRVFEPFRCKMIRYHTVANGDEYCDFWQVGDTSTAWKEANKDKLV